MMTAPGYIVDIATAVPQPGIRQEDALAFMLEHLSLDEDKKSFLRKVYPATAIDTRHSVAGDFTGGPNSLGIFAEKDEPSMSARNAMFAVESDKLGHDVMARLIEQTGIDPRSITHLVTATCTGFTAPGFDCHIIESLGLDPAVQRFNIGFMGCFAAFPALRLASHICGSCPDARVAVVNLELCTLHFSKRTDRETIVTQSLFSDGASAALVTARPPKDRDPLYTIHRFASRLLTGSARDMTWTLGDHGFQMGLGPAVPALIQSHICEVRDEQCKACGISPEQVKHWALHPGGRAILDKIETSLALPPNGLAVARKVLRENGNMSSATVMFVLKETGQLAEKGLVFSAAFGPGMTVESAVLERV